MRKHCILCVGAAAFLAFSCEKPGKEPVNPGPEPTKNIAVQSVSLNKTSISLSEGESETLTATVAPDNATDKTVPGSTSNAQVATVANGKVTAVAKGEAIITAKAGGKEATCKVSVKDIGNEPYGKGNEHDWE